jgi:hypothetical protein
VRIVLVHESDGEFGGCEFGQIMGECPRPLQAIEGHAGQRLFDPIAVAWARGAHQPISIRLLALALGAVDADAKKAAQAGGGEGEAGLGKTDKTAASSSALFRGSAQALGSTMTSMHSFAQADNPMHQAGWARPPDRWKDLEQVSGGDDDSSASEDEGERSSSRLPPKARLKAARATEVPNVLHRNETALEMHRINSTVI